MIEDLIRKNRSCRRFYQNQPVPAETLEELVNLARLSASGANLQPLAYILSSNSLKNQEIFPCLGWAGYLKDWAGPEEGERPSAYIIILLDTQISKNAGCDHGIAAQSILLGAREKGLAGCMIGTVNRKKMSAILNISSRYEILLAIAIGSPKETIVIEAVGPDGSIRYWRDEKGGHHVPKRSLNDIIISRYR
jgi:nitroreductase